MGIIGGLWVEPRGLKEPRIVHGSLGVFIFAQNASTFCNGVVERRSGIRTLSMQLLMIVYIGEICELPFAGETTKVEFETRTGWHGGGYCQRDPEIIEHRHSLTSS